MTKPAPDQDLSARLAEVSDSLNAGIDADAVRSVLTEMLKTMNGNFGGPDMAVIEELEALSAFIEETKAQIAAIRPEEIPDEHIPTATDELDAVVSATEVATNSIMEASELIEAVAEAVGGEHEAKLSEAVTSIYEACSFQDITGQRIGKVVAALREIEVKVETIVEKFGPDPETREKLKEERKAQKEATEPGPEGFDEEDLLEGPQMPENANSQDEIDALLADMG